MRPEDRAKCAKCLAGALVKSGQNGKNTDKPAVIGLIAGIRKTIDELEVTA